MPSDEGASSTRTRYYPRYAAYCGKRPDAVPCSVDLDVDLELLTLGKPYLSQDEPATMDKFDWTEKVLIVVSVSTVLVLFIPTRSRGHVPAVRCRVDTRHFSDLARSQEDRPIARRVYRGLILSSKHSPLTQRLYYNVSGGLISST
jgi:hypothetical protein